MLTKMPIGKSTIVPKENNHQRGDYTDKISYGLHVGQGKLPSQSSGGSIEGDVKPSTVSMKTVVTKNMRIRETPIRVRNAGAKKVILRKNSKSGLLDEPTGYQA